MTTKFINLILVMITPYQDTSHLSFPH